MARNKGDTVQGQYLNTLRRQRMTVMVYLVSGMRQVGMIESFDQHAVLLRHGASMQFIYKHMIASIMPAAKALPAPSSSPATRTVSRPQASSVPGFTLKVARRTIIRDE
jgi:host factor-I protein